MTQSRSPQTKPSIPVPRRTSENAPAPSKNDDIPRGEFIDVLTNKPVEPSRLQVFPVPEEFLNKVHASKPPHLRPDDVKDTVPRGLPQRRPAEPVPPSANSPIADELPRSSKAPAANNVNPARAVTERPRNTVHLKPRPPASALTRWALTGKIPASVKVCFAALLGGLFLILVWQHWDNTALSSESPRALEPSSGIPGASVPLIDPPAANVADPGAIQRPVPLAAPAAAAALEPIKDPDLQSVSDLPVIGDSPKDTALSAKKAQTTRTATSLATASKSSDAAEQVHAVPVASSSPRSITPLFAPR